MRHSNQEYSKVCSLNVATVDDEFVERAWKQVQACGGLYSIGDGACFETFRQVLFDSSLVVYGPAFVVRFENRDDCIEIHPIVLGHSFFADSPSLMAQAAKLRDTFFAPGKEFRCIVPDSLIAARHLAKIAGFEETDSVVRELSAMPIRCTVYTWRETDE